MTYRNDNYRAEKISAGAVPCEFLVRYVPVKDFSLFQILVVLLCEGHFWPTARGAGDVDSSCRDSLVLNLINGIQLHSLVMYSSRSSWIPDNCNIIASRCLLHQIILI